MWIVWVLSVLPPLIALLTAILKLLQQSRQTHLAVTHLTLLTHSALERTLGRNAALEVENAALRIESSQLDNNELV